MLQQVARKAVALYRRARLDALGNRVEWRSVSPGLEMEIDPADAMDRSFYLGTYDPWLLHVLDLVLRPGDAALDVGAHKGYVALQLARRVGPAGTVLAFEPDPRARRCLERNRDRNRMTNTVRVFDCALGDVHGEAEFALSDQLGWSSFHPNAEAQPAVRERVAVAVRRLDDLIVAGAIALDPSHLSFVKLDAEGAEPRVLRGMSGLLSRSDAMLWVEVNRPSLSAADSSAAELEGLLRGMGFSLWGVRRFRRVVAPRVRIEPLATLENEPGDLFDLIACRGTPADLPLSAARARPRVNESDPRRFEQR